MAVYPGATYRPLNQFSYPGELTAPLGAVLHVNVSAGPSLYNWIKGNPSRPGDQMSCHFQVAYDGTIEQYVDTANASWCQTAGNRTYISIETEGFPTAPLTTQQVAAIAKLYTWLHNTHGIPYVIANEPGQRGFGWHGMGGNAWGGHPGCPGDLRKAQRAHILALANPPIPEPDPLEAIMQFYANRTEFEAAMSGLMAAQVDKALRAGITNVHTLRGDDDPKTGDPTFHRQLTLLDQHDAAKVPPA